MDRPASGVAVLDARTGAELAVIPLPPPAHEWMQVPPPIADPATGQVLAFRNNVVYVVDPKDGIVETIPFDITPTKDCRTLTEPIPINWGKLDPDARMLYLDFYTYVCVPWVGEGIVAYDLNARRIVEQRGMSDPENLTPAGGRLYGSGWYRMGQGFRWAWQPGESWAVSSGWSFDASTLAVDARRNRVYETVRGALRVYDAGTMNLLLILPSPAEGPLAHYDPATDQLVFVSGATWPAAELALPPLQPLTPSGPPELPVTSVVVSPDWPQDRSLFGLWNDWGSSGSCYVFYGAGGRFHLSVDGGRVWASPFAELPGDCRRVSAFAVSPEYGSDRTLFASVVALGLFKSTDGGASWSPSGLGIPDINITEIAVSPGFGADRTLFVREPHNQALYRSADAGATWQRLGVDYTFGATALSPEFDRDRTLLAVKEGRVVRSQDAGDTWQPVGDLPAGDSFVALSLAPLYSKWQAALALGSSGKLYRTTDGGRTWSAVLDTGRPSAHSVQILYDGGSEEQRQVFLSFVSTDAAGPHGQLYRSPDGGLTWQPIPLPTALAPTSMALSPDFARDGLLFAGTAAGEVITLDTAGTPVE